MVDRSYSPTTKGNIEFEERLYPPKPEDILNLTEWEDWEDDDDALWIDNNNTSRGRFKKLRVNNRRKRVGMINKIQ